MPDPGGRAPRRPPGRGWPRRAAGASAAAARGGRPTVGRRALGSAPGAVGMRPPPATRALTGIPGFRNAASPVSVTYSGRCRMIAAEVAARCARMENASDPGEGADARAWLEARLAEALSTPHAVAGAMLADSRPPTRPDDLLALRTAAWLRLGRPAGCGRAGRRAGASGRSSCRPRRPTSTRCGGWRAATASRSSGCAP